jgi:hypothetical protein
MEIAEIRTKILQVLYQAYYEETGRHRGEVEREQLEKRLGLTPRQLQNGLDYLLQKEYVESVQLSITPPLILNYLHITSLGIDLVEGRVQDSQIVVVKGDYIKGDYIKIGDYAQNVVAGKNISSVSRQIIGNRAQQLDEVLRTFLKELPAQNVLPASELEKVSRQVTDLLESLQNLGLVKE